MKKIIVLIMLCGAFTFTSKASSLYKVDDSKIESAFEAAKPIVSTFATNMFSNPLPAITAASSKNPWIAVALDFFLGGLAIHRVYLGGTPVLILGYFITFGGIFGLVPLIDLIVLAVNNQDISKYVGSNKFFMW